MKRYISLLPLALCFPLVGYSGFYVGAQGGFAWLNTPDTAANLVYNPSGNHPFAVSGTTQTRGDLAGGGELGYDISLPVLPLAFGGEVGFGTNGCSTYTVTSLFYNSDISVCSTALDFLATAQVFLPGTSFNLFGKVGPAVVWQTTHFDSNIYVNETNPTQSNTAVEVEPMVVAGAGYQILAFNIFVEGVYIGGSSYSNFSTLSTTNAKPAQVTEVLGGVTFHF